MSVTTWALVIGAILITMALLGTLLQRLPLSPGILYLAIGYALGPAGWGLMAPDPLLHSADLEKMAEIALLISLFAVGLKLGVPLRDKRWYLPLRLAFPSMVLTVIFVTVIGVFLLGLPLQRAVLVAAITAGIALFGVGAALSLFTGRSAVAGGVRMVLIGGGAGAATWLIGSLLGAAIQ